MILKSIFTVVLYVLGASLALAHQSDEHAYPPHYIGLGAGASMLSPDVKNTDYTLVEDQDMAIQLRLGTEIADWLGLEAFYVEQGKADLLNTLTDQPASIGFQSIGINTLFYWPSNQNSLSAYAKLGVSVLDTTFDNINANQQEDTHINYGLGGQWHLSKGWSSRLEYASFSEDTSAVTLNLLKRFGGSAHPPAPRDSDQDGVIDPLDNCPDTVLGTPVDQQGCPIPQDQDRDGVFDDRDQCPNTPRGVRVNAVGCRLILDSDGDGVVDQRDQCPNTPKGKRVDRRGCELSNDTDRDGVVNAKDQCPATPAGAKVDWRGCSAQSDIDKDGVIDLKDKCPGTTLRLQVNQEGCAIYQVGIQDIQFAKNSSYMSDSSLPPLNKLADTLKRYPRLLIDIEAHTSSLGGLRYNQELSERRAQRVKEYLVKRGVDAQRLRTRGYGEKRPIGDNNTSLGRAINRRVEFRLRVD